MTFSTASMFGIHEQALSIRTRRAEILASNIANADTPGYKAQDLDFKTALKNAQENISSGTNIALTNDKHLNIENIGSDSAIMFRQNYQPDTGDGNSVDINIERMAYMQNSLEYQTTIEFLNSRINGLRKVIAGE
ncbi:MAG: flagellar basal body rod protein FlgB [Ruminobacter sp.]|nr:flagellar basal body rod protein FlgB [Ruminobacter sp.]MDY5779900.1 flagellar basal body rod protein FlgB [Succinivibrionaceae bacterium]